MKIVPSYSNTEDNVHCLQMCVKDVLTFYFPDKHFTNEEINEKTGQIGGSTWLPPAVCWLSDLGLKVKFYCDSSKFDYGLLASDGMVYLEKHWAPEKINYERMSGSLSNIDFVQDRSKEMIRRKLYFGKRLKIGDILKFLEGKNSLVISRTIHEWLSGTYVLGHGHFIVVIDSPRPGIWRINDPGLPHIQNREINTKINNSSILLDTLLISK